MVDLVGDFMRGYQQGSGLVDAHNQRKRQEKRDEQQDLLFEQSQEDRQQRLADAQTMRERGETQWQQSQEDRKTSLADAEADRKRRKTLQGREDTLFGQQQEQYAHQQTLQRRQQAEQLTGDWLNGMNEQGMYIEPPQELEAYWEENPHLDISNILTPENVIGRQQARQIMQQMAAGEQVDARDPRLVNSINQMFPEIVNNPALPKEHNGQPIVGRKISAITMAPEGNGFLVTQELELENGEKVEAPMTINRTGDPSDDVVVVPFELASQRLSSMDKLDLTLDDDMKQQLFRSRVMRGLAKDGVNTKDKSGIQKQMLAQMDKINTQEQEAMQFAQSPEEQQQIKAQYEQMRQRTRDTYAEFIGQAGQQKSQTRTDSENFKSEVKTFETAAKQMGIKWSPEVKADVEELYREGADAETVLRLMQQKYGGNEDSPEQAQSLLDSILADVSPDQTAEDGTPLKPGEFEKGEYYNVGSDLFVPGKVNQAQAEMTPYQAQQNQPQSLQQAYGAR